MRAIDLFCGWGGFSLGATQAGAQVVWCGDHWQTAVDVHSLNHPTTQHVCQDLRQADWSALPAYELLLASPACQGHSRASLPNRRPVHDAMRATAWAVVDCAEVTRPAALIVENVLAFAQWDLFPQWRSCLETLGYTLSLNFVTASFHGVPQRRERLFVIGMRNGSRVGVPFSFRGEPGFEQCLDRDAGGWESVSSAPDDSRSRLLAARANIGPRALVQHVTGHRGISLREPIRTITTKAQWVLLDGDRYRWLTPRELARGMGFPDSFTWPDSVGVTDAKKGIGNAVVPACARDVVRLVMQAA